MTFKSFTQAELEALPDLPNLDRTVTCRCGNTITIPIMPRLECHNADIAWFYVGGQRYVIVKSEGEWYKRRAPEPEIFQNDANIPNSDLPADGK